MNSKVLTTICIAGAVIAASVAAIVVTNNRAAIARAEATKAESLEAVKASEARKAKAEESAEAARLATKEAEAKAAEEKRKAQELELQAAEANERAEKAAKETAELEEKAEREKAQAAADARAEAKAKEEANKLENERLLKAEEAEIAKSNLVAQAAASQLAAEKLRSEKVIAEAKLIENRKIDFITWEAQLVELQQILAEKERALTPDKTAADLVWVNDGETDEIGGATNRPVRAKGWLRPEDNLTLPRGTRRLAREERLQYEADTNRLAIARARIVGTIEPMMVQAIKEDRIVDADFYYNMLKQLYPDWNYKHIKEESK